MSVVETRRERLQLPHDLDKPEALGAVLNTLGLQVRTHTIGVSLHHGASVAVDEFSVAEVNRALDRFEALPADRLAVKFALQRYRLLKP